MKKSFLVRCLIVAFAPGFANAAQPVGIALISTDTDISEKHVAPFITTDSVTGFPGSHGGWNFALNNQQLMSDEEKTLVTNHAKEINHLHDLAESYRPSRDWGCV